MKESLEDAKLFLINLHPDDSLCSHDDSQSAKMMVDSLLISSDERLDKVKQLEDFEEEFDYLNMNTSF